MVEGVQQGPVLVGTFSIKHLPPRHKQENLHVLSSFDFYNHTSWFQGLPLKWGLRFEV